MKTKIEVLKAKAASLRTQKLQLGSRLVETQDLAAYLKNKRAELESALEEKQNKLTSLKDVEEASMKANLRVAALTDLLKQQHDHAEEMERHLQQPSSQPVNATLADEVSEGNETEESTGKEEVAAADQDGAAQTADGSKEVESSGQEEGSKRGEWVRLETNDDDAESVEDGGDTSVKEEDHGKQETSEEAKQSEEGVQVGDESAVEVRDEIQINGTELLLNSSTMGVKLPETKDEATTSNTTETNVVGSEDGKLEPKDSNADGEEKKQTTENTEVSSTRGRRSRRTRSKGRKRKAAARSQKQDTEAPKDSPTESSQHEESFKAHEKPDDQVVDGNATEVNSGDVQLKLPEDQTGASTQAEGAEQQSQVNAVSLKAAVSSNGDENSETKSTSTESYQDTNGSEEKSDGNNSGQQQTTASDQESNSSEGARPEDGGPEKKEENNFRSTIEASEESAASHEGQTENAHGTEEGESPGRKEQSGSEQLGGDGEADEQKKSNASTDSIQRGDSATESAEEEEMKDESQQEQEPEAGNLAEGKPSDENKAEEVAEDKSQDEEAAKEDEGSKEDVKEI